MNNIEKLDDQLYKSIYGINKVGDYNEIWTSIKRNPEILREAVQIKRDKFNENDIVKGLAICEAMLIDYEFVDEVAYNDLINSIYTNTDIARIVLDGASNGGFSFLLMSLWNHNLKLTEEQKTFAVNEAMNKIGTTRWKKSREDFSKKLDDMGISDDKTTFINIDGCMNPIGEKLSLQYMNNMFSKLSKPQAHGTGEFDIRYHILRNPNWTKDEKQKLIMDFWYDDSVYDEYLEQWEWGIINDNANYMGQPVSQFECEYLYDYSYDDLFLFYNDKMTTDRIWNEIQFCKLMHELRPGQWELEFKNENKKLIR